MVAGGLRQRRTAAPTHEFHRRGLDHVRRRRPLDGGAWEIVFTRLDEPVDADLVATRLGPDLVRWTGEASFDGPGYAIATWRSEAGDPFTFLHVDRSPDLPDALEAGGCARLETRYFREILEARFCYDDVWAFDDVIRNGVPDPGGVR